MLCSITVTCYTVHMLGLMMDNSGRINYRLRAGFDRISRTKVFSTRNVGLHQFAYYRVAQVAFQSHHLWSSLCS